MLQLTLLMHFSVFLQEEICEFWGPKSEAKKDPNTPGFDNEVLVGLAWHVNVILYQASLKKQGAVAKIILLQSMSF